jgi:hypothetical protein
VEAYISFSFTGAGSFSSTFALLKDKNPML